MAVVTATRTLDPSARHDDDSKTQRRDFLSICYLLKSLPSVFVLWTFFTGFVMSSGLRVASVPQQPPPPPTTSQTLWTKHEERHPTCTCTHTRVAQVAYLFVAAACMRACVRNTAQRWHFRYLLNNWKMEKAVTWKPYLRTSQVMTYKKNIYWEINLFLQVNVFLKNKTNKKKTTNPKPYWLYCQTVLSGGPAYTHESIKDYCLPW